MHSHHATICIADTLQESSVPKVYGTQTSDVTHIIVDRFSIGDARKLSKDSLQRPLISAYRVFVLVTKKIPEESQNALLKLFEEPPAQTKFYVVIPQEGMLIPTLQSRVTIERLYEENSDANLVFQTFVRNSYANRISYIADITKNKDLDTIEQLLKGAEQYVSHNPYKNHQLLSTILLIQKYIKTPGASAKILLEELALSVPV